MRGKGREKMNYAYNVRKIQGDKPGSGPEGNCLCPSCSYTTSHTRANPCNERKCPKCGTTMTKQ